MPRQQWNDGQEVVEGDLSVVSAALEEELYDRYLYETRFRQTDVVFGDSFLCSNVNANTSQVKLGNGIQRDGTQVDPEPVTRPLYLAANTNVTHTAADGSNNRIDIISIKWARGTLVTATRNYKDPSSGAVSPQSFIVRTDWVPTLLVTAGTPAASPAVPATPAGYIKLAEVLVTASTGISGSSAYTDKRPRYRRPTSWSKIATISASQTMDLDDEVIQANANGGAIVYTLLPSASCYDATTGLGKVIEIQKSDSSANTVTLKGNGAELVNEANTQVISNQYTSLRVQANGTGWIIK